MRKRPKIASALLRHFGQLDEGAVGDLLEEFELSFAMVVGCQHIALVVSLSMVYDAAAVPPRYVFDPILPLNIAALAVPPIGALVGGMLGARRQATAAP